MHAPACAARNTASSRRAITCSAVAKAKEYIAAGDMMQVQLGQRMRKPYADSPLSLYRALRTLNPSPYMYYYNFGDFHVVGASPEILVRSEDGKASATWRFARSPARGRAAQRPSRMRRWRRSCWPIRRSAPSM